MAAEYLLEMENIEKSFPGVKALNQVTLKVRPGTVHALMGENGAGKSTLMKCLFGLYNKDSGTIKIDGEEVNYTDPKDALEHGVSMVHQELNQVLRRNVMENIWLGRFPKKHGFVDHKKMYDETKKLMDELGINVEPTTELSTISVSTRQMIEIAKAVSYNVKVLVLDEPTSSLATEECEKLFEVMEMLKKRGVSMIYISHKIDEILRISDEVTIMRDGQNVITKKKEELTTDEIIKNMVGRELTNIYPPLDNTPGDVLLEVDNFTSIHSNSFKNCSFKLRRGEILGFGGLVGAQRTELMEAIFGIRHTTSGEVKLNGKPLNIKSPKDAIRNGIGMITEDRRGSGILGCLSIADNISIASLDHYVEGGVKLNNGKIEKLVQDNIGKLSIKTPSSKTLIQSLSGGNQQKVIISRWLANNPDVLIMDEPTRGIDVGAKYEIYQIMISLAKQGKGIIMISSEMPELIGVSNRIMVMCNGKITGEVSGDEATQENIMYFATQF